MGRERQDREQTGRVKTRQAWDEIVAALRSGPDVSCTRPDDLEHRATDWRRPAATKRGKAGPWVCGICHAHPHAPETGESLFPVELRAELDA